MYTHVFVNIFFVLLKHFLIVNKKKTLWKQFLLNIGENRKDASWKRKEWTIWWMWYVEKPSERTNQRKHN